MNSRFLGQAAGVLLVAVSNWLTQGALWLLSTLGRVLLASTAPPLSSAWFLQHVNLMVDLASFVVLPLFLLAVAQAAFRQDAAAVLKVVAVHLPLSILLGAACVGLVQLTVTATDRLSAAFARAAGFDAVSVLQHVGDGFGTPASGSPPVIGAILALLIVVGSLLLWLELVLRSAAILVATLFLPLALAALVWPPTAAWARRLAETLAALIVSKLAIVAVLATGAAALPPSAAGASTVVSGAAMVLLATFMPFVLLRLMPVVEAGAVAHFEGVSRRASRAVGSAGTMLANTAPQASLGSAHESGFSPEPELPPLASGGNLPDSYLAFIARSHASDDVPEQFSDLSTNSAMPSSATASSATASSATPGNGVSGNEEPDGGDGGASDAASIAGDYEHPSIQWWD